MVTMVIEAAWQLAKSAGQGVVTSSWDDRMNNDKWQNGAHADQYVEAGCARQGRQLRVQLASRLSFIFLEKSEQGLQIVF